MKNQAEHKRQEFKKRIERIDALPKSVCLLTVKGISDLFDIGHSSAWQVCKHLKQRGLLEGSKIGKRWRYDRKQFRDAYIKMHSLDEQYSSRTD